MSDLAQIVERIRASRAVLRRLEAEHLRIVTERYGPGDGLAQIGFRPDEEA